MNRLYYIVLYLVRVASKWCNTVKDNNNLTDAITSVPLPVSLHNDFPGEKKKKKPHFLSHGDFISPGPIVWTRATTFYWGKGVCGHSVQRTHKQGHTQTLAHNLYTVFSHTLYLCGGRRRELIWLSCGDWIRRLFISALYDVDFFGFCYCGIMK